MARGYSDGFKTGMVACFAVLASAAFLTGVQISIAPEILARKKPATSQSERSGNVKKSSTSEAETTTRKVSEPVETTESVATEPAETAAVETTTEPETEAATTETVAETTTEPETATAEPETTDPAATAATDTTTAETIAETAETIAEAVGFDVAWADTPFVNNAAAFENEAGMPVMSVVLVHDDSTRVDVSDLVDFPYPLTFAIKAEWDGAAGAARAYRDAGYEVLLMADLPRRGVGGSVSERLSNQIPRVPGALGVLEGVNVGIDIDPGEEEELAAALRENGYGLVTVSREMGTAQQLIAREGIPSTAALRYFGGLNLKAPMVARFLDQAALRAQQSKNGVITIGRMSDETIKGLVQWGLEERASRIILAPVSAVMRGSM